MATKPSTRKSKPTPVAVRFTVPKISKRDTKRIAAEVDKALKKVVASASVTAFTRHNDDGGIYDEARHRVMFEHAASAPVISDASPRRTLVVLISDIHGGSKHGVYNPDTEYDSLDSIGDPTTEKHEPSIWSSTMWPAFGVEWPARVAEMAQGDPVTIAYMGDITQGSNHPEDLYALDMSEQLEIALWALKPWLSLPTARHLRVIAGTASHEYDGGAARTFATMAGDRHARLTVTADKHGMVDIGGVWFDLSHHGPSVGRTSWTTENAARSYAKDILIRDAQVGRPSPRVIVRGHVHVPVSELVRYGQSRAWMIVCPANQGPNTYARKAARSPIDWTFGVVVIEIVDGKIVGEPIEMCKTLDIRTRRETTYD